MTDDQKKNYEEAAKAHADNECEDESHLMYECCRKDFLAGATHAHNKAIDAALTTMKIEWREDRHDIYNAIEKLKI